MNKAVEKGASFNYNLPVSGKAPVNNENVSSNLPQPQFVSKYAQQLYLKSQQADSDHIAPINQSSLQALAGQNSYVAGGSSTSSYMS